MDNQKGNSGSDAVNAASLDSKEAQTEVASAKSVVAAEALDAKGKVKRAKTPERVANPDLNLAYQNAKPTVEVNLQTLLEAGAHFGHQTARWCPAMAPYIYTSRNGIHIINLPKTVQCWEKAKQAIRAIVAQGGNVVFVGTKKQAQDSVIEEAKRCGAFYVARRWLGGMLTNFQTIRKSIERMNKLETILAEEEALIAAGNSPKYKKKERLMMSKEREKLEFSLGGIKDMYSAPQLLFVIDIKREDIAIKEAKRLDIPVVALVDTNCDPKAVNYAIPSNDDGTRAIKLFTAAVADAVIEGRKLATERRISEAVESKKRSEKEKSDKAAAKTTEVAGSTEEKVVAVEGGVATPA